MRFGLFGGPARRHGAATDREAYAGYIESVLEAEALGFYGTYLVEHHFTGQGQVSSSLNVLSHLAALTTTLRLGTAVVVVPWHNPVLLAEQAATVDLLSNGRLDLGLGRGYRDLEFLGFGIDRDESLGRFHDTVAFLREAWTNTERFSFDGEHWTFADVLIEPKPVQSPHPPIWVGAASETSIKEAAANGFHLFLDQVSTFEEVARRVQIYREAQTAAGVAPHRNDIALTRPLLLAGKQSERAELLDSHLGTLEFLANSSARPDQNPFYSDPASRRARAEAGAIVGTASQCIERLRQLAALGIHQVLFTRTTVSALRHFAEQVLPAFADVADRPTTPIRAG